MTVELPADVHVLRTEIGRASLTRSFREVFNEEPPGYLINNPREIARAAREWREYYAPQLVLLARVSQQALGCLDLQGLGAAIHGFTSSVTTQPELDGFMHANVYLEELVAYTCRDADLFHRLLGLLIKLGELDR